MLSQQKKDVIKKYNGGLDAYKLRKWDEAIRFFNDALAVDPDDGPSKLYLQRSLDYKKTPPPDDWDGVFTMTTK